MATAQDYIELRELRLQKEKDVADLEQRVAYYKNSIMNELQGLVSKGEIKVQVDKNKFPLTHPDTRTYADDLWIADKISKFCAKEVKTVQADVEADKAKLARFQLFMTTKFKRVFIEKIDFHDNKLNAPRSAYGIMEMGDWLEQVFRIAFLPSAGTSGTKNPIGISQVVNGVYKNVISENPYYDKTWFKKWFKAVYFEKQFENKFTSLTDKSTNRFEELWPYIDIVIEAANYINRDVKGYTGRELYDLVGDQMPLQTLPPTSQIRKDSAVAVTTFFNKAGMNKKYNSDLGRYELVWPSSYDLINTDGSKVAVALQSFFQQYANMIIRRIKAKSATLETVGEIYGKYKTKRQLAFTKQLVIKDFNESINDPKFPPFPTSFDLIGLADQNKVPLSVAFEIWNNNHNYQKFTMAYPKFVIDWVLYRSISEQIVDFHALGEGDKQARLARGVAEIQNLFYPNDSLIKLIEHRNMIFSKYRNTFTSIDRKVASDKIDRIVATVKSGFPITDATMGRIGFEGIMPMVNSIMPQLHNEDMSDGGMGWSCCSIKISLPKITIAAPKIVIPKIELPKLPEINLINIVIPDINLVNIVMPNNITDAITNPITGLMSFVGASDDVKDMANNLISDMIDTPIYIPVVSEAIGTAEKIIQNPQNIVSILGEEAMDTFENTGKILADSPRVLANVIDAGGQAMSDVIFSPAEDLIDGVAYAILPADIAEKIDSITDLPRKSFAGGLTTEDITDAGTAALKLAIAPAAFTGKITGDALNAGIENVPLIKDLDNATGGLLTSGARVAMATSDEYEGKAVNPYLVEDVMKVGAAVAIAYGGYHLYQAYLASSATSGAVAGTTATGSGTTVVATTTTATTATTGAGGVIVGEVWDEIKQDAKDEVKRSVGYDPDKSITANLYEKAKEEILESANDEITKITGYDPRKSPYENLKDDAAQAYKDLIASKQAEMRQETGSVLNLADGYIALGDFKDQTAELKRLIKIGYKKIDARMKSMDKYKEIRADEKGWIAAYKKMNHLVNIEKDYLVYELYCKFYLLRDFYAPEKLLAYMMYNFGPRKTYDDVAKTISQAQYDAFVSPDGRLLGNYKHGMPLSYKAGIGIAGLLGTYAYLKS